ncbi:hypothetical protein EHS25_001835 [Saitozyma podzolica]|uniref:Major facilitator superfamily (MFS) profile domain-containing protein n=1 Tax=Saitozyma podzolica TaxID=1890683 RepID=A0A427YF83_9TREE|nr:hypothetical protein EHS25_001835 [Saitozyma podzolica]
MKLAAPAYCTEIAPPQWRGKMAGVLNCGYYGGSISAAAITFGTNYVNNDWCWRIPLIGQALPALVDEAMAFLEKYHGNKDPDSAVVALEWQEFEENIAFDASDKL